MMMTPRHGRRRSGSSVRGSPLSGHGRRASGPRTAAHFSPFIRPRTGSDDTCATCIAASSFASSACSIAVDVASPARVLIFSRSCCYTVGMIGYWHQPVVRRSVCL